MNTGSDYRGFRSAGPTFLANVADNTEQAWLWIDRADDKGRLSHHRALAPRRLGRTAPILAALQLPAAVKYCGGACNRWHR